MKKTIRLTERDLTRIVKRVIKENKLKKEPINEGLNDYLTLIGGTLVSFATIKLFGRKILVQLFGLFARGLIKATCYKELESIMELMSKDTNNLQVEYKKIKDYYQIIIDLKSFSSEYLFADSSDYKPGQLQSDNFPVKLKLYDDGTVEYLCNTGEVIRERSKGNIYGDFVNFIKSYGKENPKLRGHTEDKEIFKVLTKTLKPNFQSKVDQYNILVSMDSNDINKMSSEISQKLDIPQDIITRAMERHQPNEMKDEETISDDRYYSPIWDFINNIYKDITENNNDVTLTETDLTKLIKKMIRESKFSKITSVGVAGLAATGVIMFVNDYNDVQITDKDGNSYEAETGDIFTGKIIDMEGIGKDGNTTSITIRTKDGKEVQFITYQRVYHLKPGDKLTIKVAPDTFISDRGKIQY